MNSFGSSDSENIGLSSAMSEVSAQTYNATKMVGLGILAIAVIVIAVVLVKVIKGKKK